MDHTELSAAVVEKFVWVEALKKEMGRVLVGQSELVDRLTIGLLTNGHILLEGVPGLAKTLAIRSLAGCMKADFSRLQFTPDLLPADLLGTMIYSPETSEFSAKLGPVFANLILADEINRSPAKTQAALLEVMQERQVTIDGETIKLDPPFMALATQNPIEQEGTYPLPEAQLDRFLMKVVMDYPTHADEAQVVRDVTSGAGLSASDVETLYTPEDIIAAQQAVTEVRCVDEVVNYAVNIARATRETQGISLGAGTRGAISLVRVAKAYAFMAGRSFVTPDDIKQSALPVLRHRVQLAPELAISGQNIDDAIHTIVAGVEAPRQ